MRDVVVGMRFFKVLVAFVLDFPFPVPIDQPAMVQQERREARMSYQVLRAGVKAADCVVSTWMSGALQLFD
jgi:hypothetical protein